MDENEHREKWDIISLSLVVNFVADARDRGMNSVVHTPFRLLTYPSLYRPYAMSGPYDAFSKRLTISGCALSRTEMC